MVSSKSIKMQLWIINYPVTGQKVQNKCIYGLCARWLYVQYAVQFYEFRCTIGL